ncbi:MAG TPA: aminodeoxychorismate/anthranilate synthase component II [Puia sp.]|nr:aminodeoxychorismate/anthranilate synthase component II [Puia sp.]
MKILVFDNYDSFTYNLVHLVEKIIHEKVEVWRNDKISLDVVEKYDRIILSPGPGIPSEAGLMLDLIIKYAGTKPILGVCLGHQGIGEAFGAKLVNLSNVYHGVASQIIVSRRCHEDLFSGLPDRFDAGRYHSWIVSEEDFPESLEITARDENNFIMALRHRQYDLRGVQFHPESVLTPNGETIMRNWLKM